MTPLRGFFASIAALLLSSFMAAGCGGSAGSGLFDAPSRDGGGVARNGGPVEPPSDATATDAPPVLPDGAADPDAATGGPCRRDVECDNGLCNFAIDRCAAPSLIGAPCHRDIECAGGLCNFASDVCAVAAVEGAPCHRDTECAGTLCNFASDTCRPKQATGGPCHRDSECTTNLCNLATDTCK